MNTKVFIQIKNQLKLAFPLIIKLYTPILILVLLTLVISFTTGIAPGIFTRDPAIIAGSNGVGSFSLINIPYNPFVGFISNLGILFWCISASVCFFTAVTIQNIHDLQKKIYFLYCSGIITSILLLDDLFLLHEAVFPMVLKIPEKIVYLIYAIIIIYWILKFSKIIIETEWNLLFLSILFFGFSLIIDVFFDFERAIFIEDAFKLLGIFSWLCYFLRVCFRVMNKKLNDLHLDQ